MKPVGWEIADGGVLVRLCRGGRVEIPFNALRTPYGRARELYRLRDDEDASRALENTIAGLLAAGVLRD